MNKNSRFFTFLEDNILWLGIFVTGFYWFLDAFLHVHIFNNGTMMQQIFSPTSHEIWTRVLVMSIFISSSSFVQSYIIKRKGAEETLMETGKKFQTLFDSANDAIFIMEKDLFTDCNKRTLELFGCTREQIIGQPPYKFSPEYQPDGQPSRKSAKEKINAVLSGEPQRFEWKHCQYDGTLFDAEVNLSPMKISGKIYIQAIVRDINERKRAESALRASEEKYRSLIDNANYSITLFDLKNRLIMINEAGARNLGGKIDDFVGKSIEEIFPGYAEKFIARNRDIVKTGKKLEFEDEIKMPTGQKKWFWSNLQPLKNSGQIITGVLIVSYDVTDKKIMNENLREKESLLKAILESSGDGILVVNKEGIITHTNSRFAEMWNIPDELIKTADDDKLLKFVLDQLIDPDAFRAKVKQLYNSDVKDTDYLKFRDGRIFERYSHALIRDNKIAGRVWNFRDVTDSNTRIISSESERLSVS